ncbi:TetR family transcriptional regulator [Halorhabdus sp. CBA1104]|uniref:TetR/AcrR family transcriptional regulator n=1 Tax=unclassified Halorhabdus TaxID=2621901 RepID=UPI0012B3652D|nr:MULTISPECIES: TetR/AcrR family transcriptional regulator [unclassified Halorhabdus]QGN06956.1 TetR family transcriptional regulator [Halorhabdus sp. CBA1104]
MAPDHLFPDAPEETRIEILQATYGALREHGYADVTIERIGEHFPKSTSLVYHHYDGKDELLLDFLSYLLEHAEADLGIDSDLGPEARLQVLFDRVFSPDDDPEAAAFRRTMLGLRAQATTDPAYQEQFSEHDAFFRDRLAAIVREGVEDGTFRDVDPEAVATMLHATITGAMTHRSTAAVDLSTLRAEAEAYVESRLLAEG